MKKILFILLSVIFVFAACNKDDNGGSLPPEPKKRTVIVYLTADNNISSYLSQDLSEMMKGARNLSEDCNLIAFVDVVNQTPFVAKITADSLGIVRKWSKDFYSTDPDSMLSVFQWIINKYPAHEYATIFEGHGSGSIINKDTLANKFFSFKAYGYDQVNATSSKFAAWINVPTIAKVLEKLPHMEYIFFDCCCMANIETVYELRKSADYIIAPTSETPAKGAPYESIVPLLSMETESACNAIIQHYVSDSYFGATGGVCLAAIKTSELKELKDKTKSLLLKIYKELRSQDSDYNKLIVDRKHCIYYYRDATTRGYNVLHDMKCVFRHALDEEYITEADYNTWLASFNNAVVFKSTPKKTEYNDIWMTDRYSIYPSIDFDIFRDFFTPDYYGALSMTFPTPEYDQALSVGYLSVNKTMFQYEWCNDVGWHQFGW